jgi:hypothetical protein
MGRGKGRVSTLRCGFLHRDFAGFFFWNVIKNNGSNAIKDVGRIHVGVDRWRESRKEPSKQCQRSRHRY